MIASRPSQAETGIVDCDTTSSRGARVFALKFLSICLRLALLCGAGLLMQIGWLGVWTLSYRLTHGNDFTFTYLMTQPEVWNKLMGLLTLGNTFAVQLVTTFRAISIARD